MRLRCPVCHAEAALEAWAEDEAARELMALLAGLEAEVGRPLTAYLGLFRARKSALSWERSLRIAREALSLCPDSVRLSAAMSQTVESLRAKRLEGNDRPLSNHNYLKRVLEGMPEAAPVRAGGPLVDAPEMRKSSLRADRRITAAEQAAMAIRSVSFGDDDA